MGDLLYHFTEWLRTTQLVELTLWLSDTSASLWLQTHFWAIPILQCIHILSIAAAFGSILMVSLRLFSLAGTERTMAETERRYIRWIWWSLVMLVISGSLLVLSEPIRDLINPVFWCKMVGVVLAILVTISFHKSIAKRFAGDREASGGAKLTGIVLVVLWCMIMTGGRWIAYNPG
jgi:hypothetical protein